MNSVKEQAKKYVSLGWSVFPIRHNTKLPKQPWNEFRTRRISVDEVDTLFDDNSNMAVACGGLSGIMVIDQDLYKGKPGLEFVDSPLKAITPRGGIHLYFKHRQGTQNTVNDSVGTDIRSEGGYVLIPTSVVEWEENGIKRQGQYTWVTEPTRELLDTLPEAPESLLKAVYAQESIGPTAESVFANFEGVREGGRNNAISKMSLQMLNSLKDKEQVWELVKQANLGFKPPLPLYELQATFNSAVNKYTVSPPISQKSSSVLNSSLLQTLDVQADFVNTSTEEDIDETIRSLAAGKKKGIPSGFIELDRLTGGFLPGQTYLLFADTSVGKSIFSVNMLVSMAKRGVNCVYFDLENDMTMSMERIMFVANHGKVNLVDYRARFLGETVDVDYLHDIFTPVKEIKENLRVWDLRKLIDRFGDINWAGVEQCLIEEVKRGLDVVIIDHLHYFSPAETDHAVLGEVARKLNNLAAENNISILVVAHTKKGLIEVDKRSETDEVRASRPTIEFIAGSGMISKHFKNIIALRRNSMAGDVDVRKITEVFVDKTKFGAAGRFNLQYHENTLLFTPESAEDKMTVAKTMAVDEMLVQENQITFPEVKAEEAEEEKEDEPTPVYVPPTPKRIYDTPTKLKRANEIEGIEDIPF